MRKINIDPFDYHSIKQAQRLLLEHSRWCEMKSRELLKALAEIGMKKAQIKFTGAMYDGNGDVTVTVVPTQDGYSIQANGEAVAFIEFGSGALYGYGHPQTQMETGENLSIGSWSLSEQGKGHFADPHGWYYKSGDTWLPSKGNKPAMAMYEAEQDILMANLQEIAERIFK